MLHLLTVFPSISPVFDLALLLGSEVIFPHPRPWSRVAGHDTSQRGYFCDNVCQFELFDLSFDLLSRFIADGAFTEVAFSIEPADVLAFSSSGDRLLH